MPYNPEVHRRRSIRLDGYDYRQDGMYFVTICTYRRECLLGEIVEGEVHLSPAGEAVQQTWDRLPGRFPYIALDWFAVMPNHVHGILFLGADPDVDPVGPAAACVGALLAARFPQAAASPIGQGAASKRKGAASSAPARSDSATRNPALGLVVRAFKSVSAIAANRLLERQGAPFWHRNYYERIIRNDRELHRIRAYIDANPANWAQDDENLAFVRR